MSKIEDALDALIAEKETKPTCRVVEIINAVKESDGPEAADKLKRVADDNGYPTSRLVALLRNNGYPIGKDSVHKHRHRGELGGCNCK